MRQLPQLATRPGGETNSTAPLINSNRNEAAIRMEVIARHMNRDLGLLMAQSGMKDSLVGDADAGAGRV